MWSQLRQEMVEQILGDNTQCLAKHIASQVTQYEFHPMSVQDLKEAVQPLKKAKKSWKQFRMAEFEYDLPIPEILPEHYAKLAAEDVPAFKKVLFQGSTLQPATGTCMSKRASKL